MINTDEIMLGNWCIIMGEHHKVTAIGTHSLHWQDEDSKGHQLSQYCDGIILTPKILERCGFKEIDDDGLYEMDEANVSIQLQHNYLTNNGFEVHINHDTCYIDIHYVHQLQNLVYYLTFSALKVQL